MDVREKLVEMISDSLCRHIDESCKLAENIADDLLSGGVTVQERSAPLTLDELRQMDREPVWLQFLHDKIGYWDLIGWHNSEFIHFYRSEFLIIDEYGKSFLAYRQKPTADKHEAN